MNKVVGDLMTIKKGIIVHQVNAMDKMGAGIAATIARKFPKHLQDYNKMGYYTPNLDDRMGNIVITNMGELTIIGIVGQKNYGNSKKTGICYYKQ